MLSKTLISTKPKFNIGDSVKRINSEDRCYVVDIINEIETSENNKKNWPHILINLISIKDIKVMQDLIKKHEDVCPCNLELEFEKNLVSCRIILTEKKLYFI